MKVKCALRNEQIDGLTTNRHLAPLPEQEQMQALDVEEMESSFKIDIRDVSWWVSIKDAYRLATLVITKLKKKRCISLTLGGKPSHVTHKHE